MRAPRVRPSTEALQEGMTKSLLDQLSQAHLRIAEIERDHRGLISERDELARNLSNTKEALSERLTPPHLFWRSDAARISATLARLSLSQRREIWLGALSQLKISGNFFALYP